MRQDVKADIFDSVPVSKFHAHVKEQSVVIDSAYDSFDIEFDVLGELSQQPAAIARIYVPPQSVWKKNRYTNILPHADTRVKLSTPPNATDPAADYINASHIRVCPPRAAAATHARRTRTRLAPPISPVSLVFLVCVCFGLCSRGGMLRAPTLQRVLPGCNAQYICTQAPTEASVEDFWRMIWEQGSKLIVMLTKEVEKDGVRTPLHH